MSWTNHSHFPSSLTPLKKKKKLPKAMTDILSPTYNVNHLVKIGHMISNLLEYCLALFWLFK